MKNLKVRTKLILSFGLMAVILVATVLVGLVNVSQINDKVGAFGNDTYQVIQALNKMSQEMKNVEKSMYQAVANMENPDGLPSAEANDAISGLLTQLDSHYSVLEEHLKADQDKLSDFQSKETALRSLMQQVTSSGNTKTVLDNEIAPLLAEMDTVLNEISNNADARGDAIILETGNQVNATMILFISAGVLSLVVAIVLFTLVTKSIVVPLGEMEGVAKEIAEGNLKVSLAYTSRDEFGSVADSMRSMVETLDSYVTDIKHGMKSLAEGDLNVTPSVEFKGDFVEMAQSIVGAVEAFNGALTQISNSSEQVSAGSEQVSSGAQALSQGATEQASSVEELAATINEISVQVKENADNARIASEKVNYVGNEMTQSNQKMQDMIAAMDDISRSSSEIGKIIKTIEDIAFQTNLLALNAAVEAARAGTAGKGFAVVADEVRSLANRSSEASKNTSALIETSLKSVENGARIVDETAQSLMQAVSGAAEVTEAIDKISMASAQQADAITQITVGIDQISAVVQTNSATAEQSAAASEELSGQAQMLKNLVGEFNLKKSEERPIYQPVEPVTPARHSYDLVGVGGSKY